MYLIDVYEMNTMQCKDWGFEKAKIVEHGPHFLEYLQSGKVDIFGHSYLWGTIFREGEINKKEAGRGSGEREWGMDKNKV